MRGLRGIVRATAIALAILCSLPAAGIVGAASYAGVSYFHTPGPGWWIDRFTTTDSNIYVGYEAIGKSDTIGLLVYLFDGNGKLLSGGTDVWRGGDQIVGRFSAQDTDVSPTGLDPTAGTLDANSGLFHFVCPSSCNPSREFKILLSAGGDGVTSFALNTILANDYHEIANASGTQAFSVPTHAFAGTVVAAELPRSHEGVSVTQDATLGLDAQHSLVGSFIKFSGSAPTSMRVDAPSGTTTCARACTMTRSSPGHYTLHYTDTDDSGSEAYATWADVQFP